jgi:hypothetical protein
MRNELDEILVIKYPKIFADRHGDKKKTLMCWGFSHGDGWYNIIDMLCANIQSHIDSTRRQRANDLLFNRALMRSTKQNYKPLINYFSGGKIPSAYHVEYAAKVFEDIEPQCRIVHTACPQVVAVQVKEKYGTLRFYYDGGDDYIQGLVALAESMSSCTCEECGAPGTTDGMGWIRTLCKTHATQD